jgi:hypothetical protein
MKPNRRPESNYGKRTLLVVARACIFRHLLNFPMNGESKGLKNLIEENIAGYWVTFCDKI